MTPEGWVTRQIPNCCEVSLPREASFSVPANLIDSDVADIQGPGFRGMFTVTQMGSGVLPATSGRDYNTSALQLDGRQARTASYSVEDAVFPERRHLLWTFDGVNNGTGKNLILDLSCKQSSCDVFFPIVRSLKVTE